MIGVVGFRVEDTGEGEVHAFLLTMPPPPVMKVVRSQVLVRSRLLEPRTRRLRPTSQGVLPWRRALQAPLQLVPCPVILRRRTNRSTPISFSLSMLTARGVYMIARTLYGFGKW